MAQEAKLLKTVPFSPIQKVGQPFVKTIEGDAMFVDHRTYDFEPGKINSWLQAYETLGKPVQDQPSRPVAVLRGDRMRPDQPGGLRLGL